MHIADTAAARKPDRPRPAARGEFLILAGTANRGLAAAIGQQVGVPLGACAVERYPDGEVSVELGTSVAATHGLLLEGAREQLDQAGVREVVVTDTVAVAIQDWSKLHVVSVAPLLAGAVRRFVADRSLGDLF